MNNRPFKLRLAQIVCLLFSLIWQCSDSFTVPSEYDQENQIRLTTGELDENLLPPHYPKIGIALSGGGARGIAHIGVLKVIDELGISIDYISGTSFGAMVGGLYAIGYSASEIEEMFLNIDWNEISDDSIERKDFYVGEKRWKEYYNFSFILNERFTPSLPQGFLSGHVLVNYFFDKLYPHCHIEDFNHLPIPFSCVATDLLTGEMIVYQQGSLHEAIRASVSVPSLIKPFYYQGKYTVDGGIKMNLPTPIVKEMGADLTIGVKVTSDLRSFEQLTNPVVVLDQTINISTLGQKQYAVEEADILVQPNLKRFGSFDYHYTAELIAEGELAARKAFSDSVLTMLKKTRTVSHKTSQPLPDTIKYERFNIEGNRYLSSSKIKEYSQLNITKPLTKIDIAGGIDSAYKTNLFNTLYPVVTVDTTRIHDVPYQPERYNLTFKALEKHRNHLGINIRYNENDDIILGAVLEMKNYIGRNSVLLAAFDIGKKKELLIDYVKNYGHEWGAYFRLFPYVNEHVLYFYKEQQKESSSKSLEYGACIGTGGFFFNNVIIEPFVYSYHKKLYSNISHIDIDESFLSSGVGVKLFHQTLNDTTFPMTGKELFLKYSHSSEQYLSDYSYNKFYTHYTQAIRLIRSTHSRNKSIFYRDNNPKSGEFSNTLSLLFKFQYGSYFKGAEVEYDPFLIGGLDSFIGLRQNEKSAPVFKIISLTSRANIFSNLFFDIQFNLANLSNLDYWDIDSDTYKGVGIVVGYKTIFAPVRVGIGSDFDYNIAGYISIGYDFDAFELSRR